MRAAYARGVRSALYVLPTGGGKTATFSFVAQSASLRGNRVVILVHRQELLLQASQALTKFGVAHGLIAAGQPIIDALVQVASVQTIVRRLDSIPAPDLVIVDEAHHAAAKSYRAILSKFPRARILGVTATPVRGDGSGFGDIFQTMIEGPTIAQLIAQGFLVAPTVFAPPVGVDLTGVHKRGGDYDKGELNKRIDRPAITGSAVEHYNRLAPGEPAIAFCVSIDNAEHVAAGFRAAGYKAVRVDGKMDDQARRAAIAGLGDGSIDILTSADLIGEGVDVPRCSVAILLRPTYSTALYLQQVGRALRPHPGKTRALILDHVGNTMRHGFPDDDRTWTLAGDRDRRAHAEDEIKVRVAQCPACYFVYEYGPPKCPKCSHETPARPRSIAEIKGELAELDRQKVAEARARKGERAGATTLEDLIALGKKRGYANAERWAQHVYNGRKVR